MKNIKISNKNFKTFESARLLAQANRSKNINQSQMVEILAYEYLENGE